MSRKSASSNNKAKRGAALAFAIRIASAALAFLSQVFLARWLGAHEFGIFTYLWVWVSVVGTLCAAGFNTTVIRFIAEYTEAVKLSLVRGFLYTGRMFSFWSAAGCALIGYAILFFWQDDITDYYRLPAAVALLCLPAFALTDFQDGVGRAKGWIDLALGPPYILRPLLLLLFVGGALWIGWQRDAVTAVAAAAAATWLTAIVQYGLQKWRMARVLPGGQREYRLGFWLKISLPVIVLESFGLLMMQLDVLLLEVFVTPEKIAIYFAAARTISLVNFVHFSIQAVAMPRFASLYAAGDNSGINEFLQQCRKWMFALSLLGTAFLLAVGKPILSMFGEEFVAGYPVMLVLACGLLVRAAAGPLQGLLVVTGKQNAAALALGITVIINIWLNILLIPRFGLVGAATATATAFAFESLLFWLITRVLLAGANEQLSGDAP